MSSKQPRKARKAKVKIAKALIQSALASGPKQKRKPAQGNRMISAPAAKSYVTKRVPPRMTTLNLTGAIVVSHREYFKDLDSTAFGATPGFNTLLKAPLANPAYQAGGNFQQMFPWLSTLASRFQRYRFRRMALVYAPLVGTGTSGKIYLSASNDVKDSVPTTKAQFLEMEGAVSCPVWGTAGGEIRYQVPQDFFADKREMLYLRQFDAIAGVTGVSNAADLLDYDFCQFFIAVSRLPAGPTPGPAETFGELSVEYEVELHHPVEDPSVGVATPVVPLAAIYARALPTAGRTSLTDQGFTQAAVPVGSGVNPDPVLARLAFGFINVKPGTYYMKGLLFEQITGVAPGPGTVWNPVLVGMDPWIAMNYTAGPSFIGVPPVGVTITALSDLNFPFVSQGALPHAFVIGGQGQTLISCFAFKMVVTQAVPAVGLEYGQHGASEILIRPTRLAQTTRAQYRIWNDVLDEQLTLKDAALEPSGWITVRQD